MGFDRIRKQKNRGCENVCTTALMLPISLVMYALYASIQCNQQVVPKLVLLIISILVPDPALQLVVRLVPAFAVVLGDHPLLELSICACLDSKI